MLSKRSRPFVIVALIVVVMIVLWLTFPKVQPYEIVFKGPTKIMSKQLLASGEVDPTSEVLEVAQMGSTALIMDEWQAKKFPVFKVKTPSGAVGFIFSRGDFAKKTANP